MSSWPSRAVLLTAVLLCLSLAGCGFRPLHGQQEGLQEELASELADVEIAHIPGRDGQQLMQALRSILTPESGIAGGAGEGRYLLEIVLQPVDKPMLIERDRQVLRFNLVLVSSFRLIDRQTGKTRAEGAIRAASPYNVVDEDFATYVTRKDAVERAADELAEMYRQRLIQHFSRSKDL